MWKYVRYSRIYSSASSNMSAIDNFGYRPPDAIFRWKASCNISNIRLNVWRFTPVNRRNCSSLMLLRFSYHSAISSVDHSYVVLSIQALWIASSATPPRNDDAEGYARALFLLTGPILFGAFIGDVQLHGITANNIPYFGNLCCLALVFTMDRGVIGK